MTDETTTEQLAEIEGQGDTVQVREGRWRTRGGEIVNVTPSLEDDPRRDRFPWQDAGEGYTWRNDGRWVKHEESIFDLREYLGPIEPDKTQELPDKTQELETKTQELPEYTPPEGWRVVRFGELLQPGDMWVNQDGTERRSAILHWDAAAVSGGRCIRRIEPQPEPQPEQEPENCGFEGHILREQPQPVQVREGRWRTRGGHIRNITPTPDGDSRAIIYPWHDARCDQTWLSSGRYHTVHTESPLDLWEYLGPIEPEPTITPDDMAAEALAGVFDQGKATQEIAELQAQVKFLKNRELTLGTRLEDEKAVNAKRLQQVEELRSEVSYVQRLLGTERRRVTQLEELVTSLRTINEAQEKAFNAAGNANTDLQHRLNVVAAEWAEQAETIRRLQIELDAAQQVPADSPELRQLRADLAEVTQDRDTYRHAHELLLNDVNATHQRTKAMTVEAIAEWLEPVRLVDSPNLANETLQHLPQIMRHLTGLDSPEDVD